MIICLCRAPPSFRILFLEECYVAVAAPARVDSSVVPPLALQSAGGRPGLAGSLNSRDSLFGDVSLASGSGGEYSDLASGSNNGSTSDAFPAGSGLRVARSITKSHGLAE
jgi:hypothetical protein